jgi:soluble lytic murein transglycosylase-like protein
VTWFREPADDMQGLVRVVFAIVLAWLLFMTNLVCDRVTAHAQGFTADDTIAAIDQASAETGVSWSWLYRVVGCETGHSFNPYAVGRQGERGAAQLHPRGKLPQFYQLGYDDPYDPYQAVRFMAYRFAAGQAGAWSCR